MGKMNGNRSQAWDGVPLTSAGTHVRIAELLLLMLILFKPISVPEKCEIANTVPTSQ